MKASTLAPDFLRNDVLLQVQTARKKRESLMDELTI